MQRSLAHKKEKIPGQNDFRPGSGRGRAGSVSDQVRFANKKRTACGEKWLEIKEAMKETEEK